MSSNTQIILCVCKYCIVDTVDKLWISSGNDFLPLHFRYKQAVVLFNENAKCSG